MSLQNLSLFRMIWRISEKLIYLMWLTEILIKMSIVFCEMIWFVNNYFIKKSIDVNVIDIWVMNLLISYSSKIVTLMNMNFIDNQNT